MVFDMDTFFEGGGEGKCIRNDKGLRFKLHYLRKE